MEDRTSVLEAAECHIHSRGLVFLSHAPWRPSNVCAPGLAQAQHRSTALIASGFASSGVCSDCLSDTDPQFARRIAKQPKWLTEINVNRAKVAQYSYFEFFTANRATALK